MSVLWPILRQLATHPLKVAVTDDQRRWRGIDLLIGALHVAESLQQQTDRPHVGMVLPTGGLCPITTLAAWMLGKAVVPLNYLLKGEDLQYVCDHSGIDTIVTVQPMLDFLGTPPTVRNLLRIEDINFKRLPELRWPRRAAPDDLAVLMYTSGTSGKPKGVMLSHGNLSANIRQCRDWAQFDSSDSMMGVLPQFHIFGMTILTLVPLTLGMPVFYTARFNPKKIIGIMRRQKPTVIIAIPSMYNALMTVKSADPDVFSQVRYAISGGEPLPDDVVDRFKERLGVTLAEGYGLTETSAVTHWCRPHEYKRHSVGRAMPDVRVRIVGPDGREVRQGEEGEIRLAGPNILMGYYQAPEETAAAFDEMGYFRTGDIGREDPDGSLYITGRIKEMMIIAGENVFPREIEEVLNKHPEVEASGVASVMDPSRGEVPIGFVELHEGAADEDHAEIAARLRSHCRKYLAQYKVPREIRILEQLPRNPTGKIMRRDLKKILERETASVRSARVK